MGFVGCVDAGRWWLSISGRNPSLASAGSGDGDARGRRTLSWKRRFGVVLLPAALAPEGILRSPGSGDECVSTSSSSLGASSWSRLQPETGDGGIFAAWKGGIFAAWDGGIFAAWKGSIFVAWFAEAGRWFLFGNDDVVERSSGRGVDFGSRFFQVCLRCPSIGCFEVGAAVERV